MVVVGWDVEGRDGRERLSDAAKQWNAGARWAEHKQRVKKQAGSSVPRTCFFRRSPIFCSTSSLSITMLARPFSAACAGGQAGRKRCCEAGSD